MGEIPLMTNTPEYLIEAILPSREVHLLGGSSGSGKTTFLFQTIAKWQAGEDVLGHKSYPVPYSYISVDRSLSSVERTLDRLGLKGVITRMVCREELSGGLNLASVLNAAQDKYPDSLCYFIEGFQTLVGDRGNSYAPVAAMLGATTATCAERGITILGVCHSPKLKIEEGFQHPRELLLGSVAWAAFSDTVITMDMNEKSGIITVNILPRNAPKEELQLKFGKNGVLEAPGDTDPPRELLVKVILAQDVGTEITRAEVLEWAGGLDISTRTAERVISKLVDEGELATTVLRGTYRRVKPSSN